MNWLLWVPLHSPTKPEHGLAAAASTNCKRRRSINTAFYVAKRRTSTIQIVERFVLLDSAEAASSQNNIKQNWDLASESPTLR